MVLKSDRSKSLPKCSRRSAAVGPRPESAGLAFIHLLETQGAPCVTGLLVSGLSGGSLAITRGAGTPPYRLCFKRGSQRPGIDRFRAVEGAAHRRQPIVEGPR